jgi:hypothetical protein
MTTLNFKVKASDLFKASETDNIDFLKAALDAKPVLKDEIDPFGWSLLMVAACAGSIKAIQLLLQSKADLKVKDKAGNCAFSLAKNDEIRTILKPPTKVVKKHDQQRSPEENKFQCEKCKVQDLTFTEYKVHSASTVHQLKVCGFFSEKYFENR